MEENEVDREHLAVPIPPLLHLLLLQLFSLVPRKKSNFLRSPSRSSESPAARLLTSLLDNDPE